MPSGWPCTALPARAGHGSSLCTADSLRISSKRLSDDGLRGSTAHIRSASRQAIHRVICRSRTVVGARGGCSAPSPPGPLSCSLGGQSLKASRLRGSSVAAAFGGPASDCCEARASARSSALATKMVRDPAIGGCAAASSFGGCGGSSGISTIASTYMPLVSPSTWLTPGIALHASQGDAGSVKPTTSTLPSASSGSSSC
mmetsp:Transcript_64269/g.199384  ORF Transcript_64269/g.199384 Transcript_64269/m.199384 type:complete len:200 (+) Transcript_64269:231-830(+)